MTTPSAAMARITNRRNTAYLSARTMLPSTVDGLSELLVHLQRYTEYEAAVAITAKERRASEASWRLGYSASNSIRTSAIPTRISSGPNGWKSRVSAFVGGAGAWATSATI